jgi:hypothetical protein
LRSLRRHSRGNPHPTHRHRGGEGQMSCPNCGFRHETTNCPAQWIENAPELRGQVTSLTAERDALAERLRECEAWRFELCERLGMSCAAGASWTVDEVWHFVNDRENRERTAREAAEAERDRLSRMVENYAKRLDADINCTSILGIPDWALASAYRDAVEALDASVPSPPLLTWVAGVTVAADYLYNNRRIRTQDYSLDPRSLAEWMRRHFRTERFDKSEHWPPEYLWIYDALLRFANDTSKAAVEQRCASLTEMNNRQAETIRDTQARAERAEAAIARVRACQRYDTTIDYGEICIVADPEGRAFLATDILSALEPAIAEGRDG